MKSYDDLLDFSKKYHIAGTAYWRLYCDSTMRNISRCSTLHGENLAFLAEVKRNLISSKKTRKIIETAEKDIDKMNNVQKREVHLARREYELESSISLDITKGVSKQLSITETARSKALKNNDWKIVEPELEKLVSIVSKKAEHMMEFLNVNKKYDSLVDIYEIGATSDKLSKLFDSLKPHIIKLTKKYNEVGKDIDVSFLNRKVSINRQKKMVENLAEIFGYDVKSRNPIGKIDDAPSPISWGYYDDQRVGMNYLPNKIVNSLYGMIHELGHFLYNNNLDRDWMYRFVGHAASTGVHESSSKFMEVIYGKSEYFLNYYYPIFLDMTGNAFSDISKSQFLQAINLIRPSPIRIHADEVTYNLHCIIRFEIEKELFSGNISVPDLPQVWNDKYEKYLGIEIENDSQGVLQDGHWYGSSFGYFPTYLIGNIYSGIWFQKMKSDIKDWKECFERGDIKTITDWFTKNVYSYSKLYNPNELIELVTDKKVSPIPYIKYLEEKYTNMFG